MLTNSTPSYLSGSSINFSSINTSPVVTSKITKYERCLQTSRSSPAQSSSTERNANACLSLVPGTKAKLLNPCRPSLLAILTSITSAEVKSSLIKTTLLDPRFSSKTSSYFSLDIRRGANTHLFKCGLQLMASWMRYPGEVAPSVFRTKLNWRFQSMRRISPERLKTETHKLLVFSIVPSFLVYSLPILPMYSSPSLTVAHSHFIPLSVSPSPSVNTKRGTTKLD
mmetsp:Transcript_119777/g.178944  ORF Transcript_119777/g.178944 Transcript_119777/m.178944 type:complete len:225 (-) Transcript_119777:954-1628(-)